MSAAPARDYARLHYRVWLAATVLSAVFLAALQGSGGAHRLAAWAQGATPLFAGQLLAMLGAVGAAHYLLQLPLRFYAGFHLEHRFGLSRLSLGGWVLRQGKHLAVGGLLTLIVLEGLYALLRFSPQHWPLYATAAWVLFSVVMARVFPTVFLPIFYKTTPVEDASLVQRLAQLCARTGHPVLGVFRFGLGAETRKANAALAGLGATRRVLLSDTLIQQFPPEEIEAVLAHELGHQHHRHILKFLALSAAGSWLMLSLTQWVAPWGLAALQLEGLTDLAGVPALLLWFSLIGFLGLPLQNALSRAFEWQADRFAAATTAPAALAAALHRLGALNLADPQPPRWVVWLLYDHPPIADRVEAARRATSEH